VQRLFSSLLVWTLATLALAQVATPPAEPGATPVPGVDEAMVRFVHASPDAGTQLVVLRRADGAAGQQVTILEYGESSGYLPAVEGVFEVLLDPASLTGDGRPPVRLLDAFRPLGGRHYTVVIVGLAGGGGEGLSAWREELLADDRSELALQALVLEDPTMADEARRGVDVRLVHAAPGTDGIELVLNRGDAVDILATAGYKGVSEFTRVPPDVGTLAVRLAGGGPVVEGLADLDMTPGSIHTLVLTGTPLETAPLEPLVVTHHWLDPVLAAPASPDPVAAVVPDAVPDLDADEADWVRDLLVAVEVWLESAEDDLAGVDGSSPAAAALADLDEARRLLQEALAHLDARADPVDEPGSAPNDVGGPDAPDEDPR
jgi:hypothetical protein